MSSANARRWSTPEDIAARVRRRWASGELLSAYAGGGPLVPIEMPLRGPTPNEIGADLAAARDWVAAIERGRRGGRCYDVVTKVIGGRAIGRNEVPARAVVASYDQAWALLGVRDEVARFDRAWAAAAECVRVRTWLAANPHKAITLAHDASSLVAVYEWLDQHRAQRRYLRQLTPPGVDTKFAERYRAVLAQLLDVPAARGEFERAMGLLRKPEFVRARFAIGVGFPDYLSEVAVRADEMARMDVTARRVLVVENEVSYLTADVPADGVVLWGKGFDVDRVGRLPWLAAADVVYWGDIDTHGFAILDRLRAWLPEVRSVLMDADTLLAHRAQWVTEKTPAASALTRLTAAEFEVYEALVENAWGPAVRLEQELLDADWTTARLAEAFHPGIVARE